MLLHYIPEKRTQNHWFVRSHIFKNNFTRGKLIILMNELYISLVRCRSCMWYILNVPWMFKPCTNEMYTFWHTRRIISCLKCTIRNGNVFKMWIRAGFFFFQHKKVSIIRTSLSCPVSKTLCCIWRLKILNLRT